MPSESAQSIEPPPPRGLAPAAGILFAITAASGLAGMAAAAIHSPKPAWPMFGFELVVVISAVLGLAYAKAGCRIAPAIGLACLGGCIGAGSFLGYLSVEKALGSVNLTPFLVARFFVAAAIGGLALLSGMHGDRRSWITLIKGVLLGVPPLVGVALFILPAGKQVLNAVANLGGLAAFVIGSVAFLLLTASASASVHLVVQAFQTAARRHGPSSGHAA